MAFTGAVPTDFIPGGDVDTTIEFTVTNNGPSDVAGVVLPLRWGDFVTSANWRCEPLSACQAAGEIEVLTEDTTDPPGTTEIVNTGNTVGAGSGSGNENLTIDLVATGSAANRSVVITADLQFASRARGPYEFSPIVSVPVEDTDPANNAAVLTLTPDRRADIQVEKSAPAIVNPGASFEYEIKVSNLGPSDIGPDLEEPFSLGDEDENRPAEVGILLDDIFDSSLLGHLSECGDDMTPCWTACTTDSGVAPGTDLDPESCEPTALASFGGDIEGLQLTLKAGNSTLIKAFARTGDTASGQVINRATAALDPSDGVTELDPNNNSDIATIISNAAAIFR